MKYYAVLDTNVIVSSMLKHNSIPGEIVDLVILKTIVPLLNEKIINEYKEVLQRSKFNFSELNVEYILNIIKENGIFLDRIKTSEDFIDEDDIVFYEIVLAARKTMNAYLVTGNMKHFPNKSFVVTPKQLIEIIDGDK